MSGSCPVSARVCQETTRERDELRATVGRVREVCRDLHATAAVWHSQTLRDAAHWLDAILDEGGGA